MRRLTVRWTLLLALLTTVAVIGCSDKGTNNTSNPGSTGPELGSSVLSSGQTYSHTFKTAGVFHYHCGVHPSMKATITVNAGGSSTQEHVAISNFTLPSLTVNVGSTVTWTNNDSAPHSVISD
ncbi:MAG: plastocyanin/azurin family copper-binding protein [candidate division Zixibacteria bacterium]|jgi:plastocyanin|nr:plastocyanin/azurin family copper-binding protein [candidate division Zixibacteria bacterium]